MTNNQNSEITQYSEACQAELVAMVSGFSDPSLPLLDKPPTVEEVALMVWTMADPSSGVLGWNEEERNLLHDLMVRNNQGISLVGDIIQMLSDRTNEDLVNNAIRAARDFIIDVFIPAAVNPCGVHGGFNCLCGKAPKNKRLPEAAPVGVGEELRAELQVLNTRKLKKTPRNTPIEFHVFDYHNILVLAIGNTAFQRARAQAADSRVPLVQKYQGQVMVVQRGDVMTRVVNGNVTSRGAIEIVINALNERVRNELITLFREITKKKISFLMEFPASS
ncbi:hypothetical protein [Streptomyces sp. NPDC047981]|uniref:hypothetical protein n=1 Tax=Streptomyces sp. NPDC047981 TaxID=3154610 RepID=UPI00343BF849